MNRKVRADSRCSNEGRCQHRIGTVHRSCSNDSGFVGWFHANLLSVISRWGQPRCSNCARFNPRTRSCPKFRWCAQVPSALYPIAYVAQPGARRAPNDTRYRPLLERPSAAPGHPPLRLAAPMISVSHRICEVVSDGKRQGRPPGTLCTFSLLVGCIALPLHGRAHASGRCNVTPACESALTLCNASVSRRLK